MHVMMQHQTTHTCMHICVIAVASIDTAAYQGLSTMCCFLLVFVKSSVKQQWRATS